MNTENFKYRQHMLWTLDTGMQIGGGRCFFIYTSATVRHKHYFRTKFDTQHIIDADEKMQF